MFLHVSKTAHTPYVSFSVSGGGVNGSFIQRQRSIFVKVLSLSEDTRFEKCHL